MKKQESLQVVLALRVRHQDAAECSLSEALANMQQAKHLVGALEQDLVRTRNTPPAQAGELLQISELHERVYRVKQLELSLEQAKEVLAERKATVTHRQGEYMDARRAREVVDELLKQRAALAQQRQDKRDTKLSEDLFLGRSIRNGTLQQNETA